jgi:large subunit ribosomal protein L25
MAELKIEVQRREETGKGPSRRLRAGGMIPAVVYGGGKEPVPIQVERNVVLQLLKQGGGENAVFLLKLSGTGKSRHTMVRKIDVDPISRQVAHIDFQRILLTEKVRVQIPLELVGEAWGVKNEGGVLDFITREVEVECLPTDIPQKLEVDVSELYVGQHLEVKDLVIPPGVEVMDEPDRVMAAVAHSRVAAEVTELEEGLEEEEGLLEAEKEEPEVIGRGKEVEAEETGE